MAAFAHRTVTAKVVRISVANVRLAQVLWPGAMVAGILARRFSGMLAGTIASALLFVGLGAMLLARRNLGRHPVSVGRHTISFDGTKEAVAVADVASWTFDGSVARLYGTKFSWALIATSDEPLLASLMSVLAAPVQLQRRGSRRARTIAAAICLAGIASIPVSIFIDVLPLMLLGVVCAILGFACFAAFSQRVAARTASK
jgi:hypothetical protein